MEAAPWLCSTTPSDCSPADTVPTHTLTSHQGPRSQPQGSLSGHKSMHSPQPVPGVPEQPSIHDLPKQQKEVLTSSPLERDNSAWSLGGPVAYRENKSDHIPISPSPAALPPRPPPQINDLQPNCQLKFCLMETPIRRSVHIDKLLSIKQIQENSIK